MLGCCRVFCVVLLSIVCFKWRRAFLFCLRILFPFHFADVQSKYDMLYERLAKARWQHVKRSDRSSVLPHKIAHTFRWPFSFSHRIQAFLFALYNRRGFPYSSFRIRHANWWFEHYGNCVRLIEIGFLFRYCALIHKKGLPKIDFKRNATIENAIQSEHLASGFSGNGCITFASMFAILMSALVMDASQTSNFFYALP